MDNEPMESDARDDAARTEEAFKMLGLTPECKEMFNAFVNTNRVTPFLASSLMSQRRVNLPPGPSHESIQPPPSKRSRIATPQPSRDASPVAPSKHSSEPSLRLSRFDSVILRAAAKEYYRTVAPRIRREPTRVVERKRARAESHIESCHPGWDVPYYIDSRIRERSNDSIDKWKYYGLGAYREKFVSNCKVPTQTNAEVPPMPVVPGSAEKYVPIVPEVFVDAEEVVKSMKKFEKAGEDSSLLVHDEMNINNRDWRTGREVPTREAEDLDESIELLRHHTIFTYRMNCIHDPNRILSTKERIEETKEKGLAEDEPDMLVPVGYEFVPAAEDAEYAGVSDEELWEKLIYDGNPPRIKTEKWEDSPEWTTNRTQHPLYYKFIGGGDFKDIMENLTKTANDEASKLKQEGQDFYEAPKISKIVFDRHSFREPREDSPTPPLKENREFRNKIDCKLYYDIPLNEHEQEVHDEWRKTVPTGEFEFPYPPKEYIERCLYKIESFFYTVHGGQLEPVMFPFKIHPAMRLYLFDLDVNEYQKQMFMDLAKLSEVPNARNTWRVEKSPPKIELTPEQQAEYDALPQFDPFEYYEHRPGEEEEWVVRPRSPSQILRKSKRQFEMRELLPEPEHPTARLASPSITILGINYGASDLPVMVQRPESQMSAQICKPPVAKQSDTPTSVPLWEPLTVQIGKYPKWKSSSAAEPVLKTVSPVAQRKPADLFEDFPIVETLEESVQSSSRDQPTAETNAAEDTERSDSPMSVEQWEPLTDEIGYYPTSKGPSVVPVDETSGEGVQPLSGDQLRRSSASPIQQQTVRTWNTERSDSPMSLHDWEPLTAQISNPPVLKSPSMSPVDSYSYIQEFHLEKPFEDGQCCKNVQSCGDRLRRPTSSPIRQQTPQTMAAEVTKGPDSPVAEQLDSPVAHWEPLPPQTSDSPMLKSPSVVRASPVVAKKVRKPRMPKTLPKSDDTAANGNTVGEGPQTSSGNQLTAETSATQITNISDTPMPVEQWEPLTAQIGNTPVSKSPSVSRPDSPVAHELDSPVLRWEPLPAQTSDSPMRKSPSVVRASPVAAKKVRKPRQPKTQQRISDETASTDKSLGERPQTSSENPLKSPPMETALETPSEYDPYAQEAEKIINELIAAEALNIQQSVSGTIVSKSEERLLLGDTPTFDEPPCNATNKILERSPTPDLLKEPSEESPGAIGIVFDPNILLDENSKSPTPSNQRLDDALLEDALFEEPTQPSYSLSPDNLLYDEMYGVVDDAPMPTAEQERDLLDGLDEAEVKPEPVVPEKVEKVAKKTRRSRKSVPRKVMEETPEFEPASELALVLEEPAPEPAPVAQEQALIEQDVVQRTEDVPVVSRSSRKSVSKPATQSAPGPASEPIQGVQEPELQAEGMTEDVPVVSRTRSKSVSRPARRNAAGPAPVQEVQVPESQVPENEPASKRTRSNLVAKPATEDIPAPAPASVIEEPELQAEAATDEVPVVPRTRRKPVSKPTTQSAPEPAPGPAPAPVVQEPEPPAEVVPEDEPTTKITRSRSVAKPAAKPAARRGASRKAAPEPEPEKEPEEQDKEAEEEKERKETPATRRRKRNEDSPPPEPTRATRAKRLFLSKNNPTPRARTQADPNAPSTSTAPPPARETPTQAVQLPAAIRDLMEEEPENQPEDVQSTAAYTPIDVVNIKPEPPSEAWEIPPPISETSRKSKKRKRQEQQKVLEDMKQECGQDPDFEVTQAYATGYKKIKEEPDADEEIIVEKVTFNLQSTLVPLEPECGPAKAIRADGATNPDTRYLVTKRLWEEVNNVFLTDPYQFSKLALFLTNKDMIISRIFNYSVPVEDRIRDFDHAFIDFLIKCPKKMTKPQEKYLEYNYFSEQFKATCSRRIMPKNVTSVTLHKVITQVTEIKESLEKDAPSGLIGEAEKDNLQTAEKILCDQYITSTIRMAALSSTPWTTMDHLNRRLEMLQNGWIMFLRVGGFLRVLLALNRSDVKKMSDEFRCYCTEYLNDIKANYQVAINVYLKDEDLIYNEIIEKSGLTPDDIKELDADIRVEECDTHHYSCTDCLIINQLSVRFSSPVLLDKHSLIHSQGLGADGEGDCGNCFDEYLIQLLPFHRIDKHVNMRIAERDYGA